MNAKYQSKYRTQSLRLQNWDYAWNAAYFITLCTDKKVCYFGEVEEGVVLLSSLGVLADVLWYEIKNHAENIELAGFVVMPNHIHGVLVLNNTSSVETRHALSLHGQHIGQGRFQNQGKNSISSIVGSYKSAVTKHAHRLGFTFKWQAGFYDHIIRNQEAFNKIDEYISGNPKTWHDDKFYVR